MRPFVLVLNMLVGVSLLTPANNVSAAYGSIKDSKSHYHGKNNGKTTKKIRLQDPGDVWERIRLGMQIPRPSLAQEFPERLPILENGKPLNARLTPSAIQARFHKQPGEIMKLDKINALISAAATHKPVPTLSEDDNPGRISIQKINVPGNTMAGQTRYRTTIGFHSELRKQRPKAPLVPIISSLSANKEFTFAKPIMGNPLCLKPKGQNQDDAEPGLQLADKCPAENKYQRVNKQILWYAQRPDYLRQVAERSRPYLYHIVEKLSKNKLPLELALLPIVESAYQPTALSPKNAAGLWQFIPSTGNDFDLEQNDDYDERLDIMASTQAAVRFLSGLKQHFNGDWLLALAAYNCGQGAVDAAISRNLADGLPTDFWSLPLPEETQDYVPRLLALSSIFANPGNYHLKLPAVSNEPYFVKVKIEHHNDIKLLAGKNLSTVAQLANLSIEKFSLLNPGFKSASLPTTEPLTFLMPAANANQLHQGLAALTRITTEIQKKELPSDVFSAWLTKPALPKFPTPFLSLDMDTNQTAPRKANNNPVSIL